MSRSGTLTAAQIRQACALLRLCSSSLAKRSGVTYEAVCTAWSRDSVDTLSDREHVVLRATLETAGVRFAFDAEGRPSADLPVTSR